jgi:WD40 repeat protein
VTAAFDGTAKLWDLRKRPIQRQFPTRTGAVNTAEFSRDGARLFTIDERGDVRTWDLATGELQLEWQSLPKVEGAAVSPDEQRIAIVGDENGKARLYALRSGQLLMTYGPHGDKNYSVTFSPDGKRLLTSSRDGIMKLWEVDTGRELHTLQGHAGRVYASFSPDGKSIISSGEDKTTRLWDSESGAPLWVLSDFRGWVTHVGFNQDGTKFVTSSRDKRIAIWETRTRKKLLNFQETKLPESNSAEFDPTGRLVVSSEIDGNARVWELESGRLLGVLAHGKLPLDITHFSRDGRHILTAGEGGALVWDAELETRSEAQIDALTRCYLPLKIQSGLIFPQPTDPSACAAISAQRSEAHVVHTVDQSKADGIQVAA